MRYTPQDIFEEHIMSRRDIGNNGEEAAANYLAAHGYAVLERNFTRRGGEIDLIAEKDGCTVFVEVKTRKNDRYGSAAEYVNGEKVKRIKRTAMQYPLYGGDIRFDVIEVYYEERAGMFLIKEINHIENAF